MDLNVDRRVIEADPQELERLYHEARQQGWTDRFRDALFAAYDAAPDNLLYAAWFYRLRNMAADAAAPRRGANWLAAVPLSVVTGLLFWAISDVENLLLFDFIPQFLLWWSPIATVAALVFLTVTSRAGIGRTVAVGLGLLAIPFYAILLAPTLDPSWKLEQYVVLAAIHIPLLCWVAIGIGVLGLNSRAEDRFAFLIKSIEVMITAGLYLIAGVAFGAITVGMFAALSIELPELLLRLIAAGGFGLLPVMAVATVYDPTVAPSEQDFDQGLSRFIATMMRLLLPLTLGVLVIYILVIPFNFLEPYRNRDLLIVYNLMLFGIMGLLLGATPIRREGLSPALQQWLRRGIIAVALLVTLVSVYALSATVYRTAQGGVTLNRLTIIGWNSINIGILVWLIVAQLRSERRRWIESLHAVFSRATNAYVAWGLFLVLVVPLLF